MAKPSPEEQSEAIRRAVGHALDQWSHVELALEGLFSTTLGIHEGPAHVVLSSIRSFNARLLVMHNLLSSLGLSPELRAAWTNLYNRMSRKNDARNELAHFTIIQETEKGRTQVVLRPYYSTGSEILRGSRSPGKPRPSGFTSKQIEERASAFSKLALDVHLFNHPVGRLLAQRKEALEQARRRARKPDTSSDPTPTE